MKDLKALDEIDWTGLEHAYGPAGDVPDQLRALAATDPSEVDKSLHALYGNIFHQGSRYQATAYAVPFLTGLAADPATTGRDEILSLLASIAIGYDESWLPDGLPILEHRAELDRLRATDPETERARVAAWVEAAADESERTSREFEASLFDPQLVTANQQWAVDAYDAVRADLPHLLPLLGDADADVRTACAYLLGWFPEDSATLGPALLDRIREDTSPVVRGTALIAYGLLAGPAAADVVAALDDPAPVVRAAAAIAAARLGAADSDRVVAVLVETMTAEATTRRNRLPFLDGNLPGYAALALAQPTQHVDRAVDAVLTVLPTTAPYPAVPLVSALLGAVFPDGRVAPGTPFGGLTDRQRRAVAGLAAADFAWHGGQPGTTYVNLNEVVRAYGLPDQLEALKTYTAS
ncbi:HEAT repeat domain-containing protein [Polymorphospora lycopeni]|uniref:HEAT repeat domain-containing protein n=1 Tax=Polymorphospora lycopeni TaxID=3140240 RepID=A0ABV5CU04_9ACTN